MTKTYAEMKAEDIRKLIKSQKIKNSTAGMAQGFTQGNLVVLKAADAYDFLQFCHKNPKACPVLEVTEVGSPEFVEFAKGSDLRCEVPKYRVYKEGVFDQEVLDVTDLWSDDMVAFLIGCSFTFENALLENDIPVRHIEQGRNVPMYKTNIPCAKAGKFHGPTVVSMRPMKAEDAIRAIQITSRFPSVHGAPIHIGNPELIGINNIDEPDYGDAVTINSDELPVFWACGVTPQAVALESKPEIMITHSPGCMFVTDVKDESLSVI